jgi:hypothetical protein
MSTRKRTPDQPSTETSTAVAEPPAAAADTPQAANDNGAPQAANDNKPSFAERVGQRKWATAPDPFRIAGDYLAGVYLYESKRDRQMAIKFDEKPPQPVLDKVSEAGFRWDRENQIWAHPVWPSSAMATRINAERLYQEVRAMIRQAKGIEASPEVPF